MMLSKLQYFAASVMTTETKQLNMLTQVNYDTLTFKVIIYCEKLYCNECKF